MAPFLSSVIISFPLYISPCFISAKYVILHREERACNIGEGGNLVYDSVEFINMLLVEF